MYLVLFTLIPLKKGETNCIQKSSQPQKMEAVSACCDDLLFSREWEAGWKLWE